MFVLLPTGFGKSIIYEVLPFLFDHKLGRVDARMRSLVIVVSPLISLMADQVGRLRRRGARAAMLSSRCTIIDKNLLATENDLYTCSFLFASPEALITSKWREAMDCPKVAERIVAVIIDEAHCVSKWLVTIACHLCEWVAYQFVCVCVFVRISMYCLHVFVSIVPNPPKPPLTQKYCINA